MVKSYFNKIKDIFMFTEGGDIDNYIVPPTVTTGSILWGILLRSAVIILLTLFVVIYLKQRDFWWFSIFVFWFAVIYPAYKQYNRFHSRLTQLQEDTMCGKCNNFVAESQLCSIYDEHVSTINTPCNGECWEANPDIFYKN